MPAASILPVPGLDPLLRGQFLSRSRTFISGCFRQLQRTCSALLPVWLLPSAAFGQGFLVTSLTQTPDGALTLRHESSADSYYILRHGESVTSVTTAVQLTLGQAGVGQITQTVTPAGATAFYRVQRLPVSAPLDSDGDGIDDVYELQHPPGLNGLDATDAAKDSGNGQTWLERYVSEAQPLATIAESSPANGEGNVSVNRETIFRLNRPLAANTVLTDSILSASFAGRSLLSRRELSSDRKTVTLFYLEPLPESARVRVTFDGGGLADAFGRPPDLDGDGNPGGVAVVDFDTSSSTVVPATAITGHVYASEKNPDGSNRPLQGVIVTVDGAEETLRATTGATGAFTLANCPAGRFFVHVDGRSAVGSDWPNGAYYPFIGKAWEAAAGRTDNLAAGTGEIFLPLVLGNALQPVSATAQTTITFPPEVIAANPALAGVEVLVPPNALFDDNGTRGGRVGLAPVPPDRLPEPLPVGLNFPLVITIQTDGPQNFDRPVPVRFPNLPDPVTGQKLPPGAKTALWSFNHDTGRWELQGPMTVTADGNYVDTDPGVGVRQPGWHGDSPGCPLDPEPLENELSDRLKEKLKDYLEHPEKYKPFKVETPTPETAVRG